MGKWNQVLISGSTIHAAGITASAIPERSDANDKVLVIDSITGEISRTGSFGGGGGGTGDGFPFTGSAAISGTLAIEGTASQIVVGEQSTDNTFVKAQISLHTPQTTPVTMDFLKSRGTLTSPSAVQQNDFTGTQRYLAYDGSNYIKASAIRGDIDERVSVSPGQVPGALNFLTAQDGALKSRMFIDSTGNVGIGSFASNKLPGELLTVSGNISASRDITGRTGSFNHVSVTDKIAHTGDTNTNIDFAEDQIQFFAGGTASLQISETSNNSSVLVNPLGLFNSEFRVRKAGSFDSALRIDTDTGGITASNDISASGNIIANSHSAVSTFNLGTSGLPVISQSSGKFVFGQNALVSYPIGVTRITGSNIEMGAPVTASVISASAAGTNLIGTASHAVTASHALNSGGGGTGDGFPFTGSAAISGTLSVEGQLGHITASGDISASGDIFCTNLTVAEDITSVGDDIILKDNLIVSSSGGAVSFKGTAGGSDEGILYLDSGGTGRYALLFPGSDVVALTNRAADGKVQIRVSNSSGGGGANEITVAEFNDDLIKLDVAQKRQLFVTSTTDGDANGDYIKLGTTVTTEGKIYYYNSSGNWVETDADAAASSTGLIAVAMANSSGKGMLLKGMVTLDHDPGTRGDILYLSTTASQATSTPPSGTGDIVRVIGYCLDSSNGQIYFNPSNDHIVHA